MSGDTASAAWIVKEHIAANEHDVVYALQVSSGVGADVLPVHCGDV